MAFMTGGLSENDWVFNKVKEPVKGHEVDVCRPDTHVRAPTSHSFSFSFVLTLG